MTNAQQKKADPQIISKLGSADETVVLNAVEDLRATGSSVYIPYLADMLLNGTFQEAGKSVLSLLGDLKDKDSVPVMMEIIENENYLPVRKDFVSACWQNGLDYSDYLARFVDLVIESEMDIAFEAFTVIENAEYFPDPSVREKEIAKINRALKSADSLKSYLLTELRRILA